MELLSLTRMGVFLVKKIVDYYSMNIVIVWKRM
jgi:hypothetical protein